jgi:hypothetical protein
MHTHTHLGVRPCPPTTNAPSGTPTFAFWSSDNPSRGSGVGRYPETLQSATAELNLAGTDYLLVPDGPAPHPPLLTTLQTLLTQLGRTAVIHSPGVADSGIL